MAVSRAEFGSPVSLVLTEADRDLIARAREGFRHDFRYLEAILWQARARRPEPNGHADDAHFTPCPPSAFG